MKNKWALLDIVTLVLLVIMVWAISSEVIQVSKVDLSPKETVEVAFKGIYTGSKIDVDDSFQGEQLSIEKEWLQASIVSVETVGDSIVFGISGSGTGKSGEIFIGKQVLKIGKEFVLETERLKIPITILEIEKIGEE
ncbi:MAG: hypothetical protein JJE29_07840 [Peptostreptococcaceae bacterium]|nr:hypothetical protein [Peptostreptococcaceae bacterium]